MPAASGTWRQASTTLLSTGPVVQGAGQGHHVGGGGLPGVIGAGGGLQPFPAQGEVDLSPMAVAQFRGVRGLLHLIQPDRRFRG